jgi:hypothetical protein
MTKTLEREYFEWLRSQVRVEGESRQGIKRYTDLLEMLHAKEFVWIIPNDDNRVGDSHALRLEFLGGARNSLQQGVSILEVIVSLSRRMEFAAEGKAEVWAWQLIKNLDLHHMHDPITKRQAGLIEELLETLVWRTYDRDGVGGFFPLAWTEEDQTKVELWYQMSAYINELPEH